jgi:hypothetical protein
MAQQVNPIPIHIPSGLGGMHDLEIIVKAEIIGFRRWVADYKKYYKLALEHLGYPDTILINGVPCYPQLTNTEYQHCVSDNPVTEFFRFIGFSENDIANMCLFVQQPGDQRIHHLFLGNLEMQEDDFWFYVDYIKKELSNLGVIRYEVTNFMFAFSKDEFPEEEDRPAWTYKFNRDKPEHSDFYNCTYDGINPVEVDNIYQLRTDILGSLDVHRSCIFGNGYIRENGFNILFYDRSGNPVSVPEHIIDGLKTLILVDDDAVTSLSLTKSAEIETTISIPGGIVDAFIVGSTEEISINFEAFDANKFIPPSDDFYEDKDQFGRVVYKDMYGWLFWGGRDTYIEPNNPIESGVDMFERDLLTGYFFLRHDFEQRATPDEIGYLINNFTTIQAYTEEEDNGLFKGILGMIASLVGAFVAIFFTPANPITVMLWRVASFTVGQVVGGIYEAKMEEMLAEQQARQELEAHEREEEMLQLAHQNNRFNITGDMTKFDLYGNKNHYAAGYYMPLNRLALGENTFSIAGEYANPHTKLNLIGE